MSAKHSKKGGGKTSVTPGAAEHSTTPPAPGPGPAPAATFAGGMATAAPSWLDSTDPRKRFGGKLILVAIWIYVGALWLLALDQTFQWGIFGPKTPPL